MNSIEHAPPRRFSCLIGEKIEGPFDMIELAGQLRYATINGDTLVAGEGEEDWLAFRERPEFVAVQGIPVEAIAAHLEAKARAKRSVPVPKKVASFPWLLTVLSLGLAGIVGLTVLLSPVPKVIPRPPLEPPIVPPAAWVETEGAIFSITCPVSLTPETSIRPGLVVSYRAMILGAVFGVDTASVRGVYSSQDGEQAINGICNLFVDRYDAHVTSDRTFAFKGFPAREILFTNQLGPGQHIGGIRVIAEGGNLISAWVTANPVEFSSENVVKYLDSLGFRP
jgi:hypothetical protein